MKAGSDKPSSGKSEEMLTSKSASAKEEVSVDLLEPKGKKAEATSKEEIPPEEPKEPEVPLEEAPPEEAKEPEVPADEEAPPEEAKEPAVPADEEAPPEEAKEPAVPIEEEAPPEEPKEPAVPIEEEAPPEEPKEPAVPIEEEAPPDDAKEPEATSEEKAQSEEPEVPEEPTVDKVRKEETEEEIVETEQIEGELSEPDETTFDEMEELAGEDEIDIEDSEGKKIEYDFFPTRDTLTIITHQDVDGLLCVAAANKMINTPPKKEGDSDEINKVRVFFSSPTKIFSTLAKSIPDLNKIDDNDFTIGQLYICDLSLHRDTLLGSTIYDKTKWFDHHEVNPEEQYDSEIDNVELVIDPTANSTTSVMCEYFKIDGEFGALADEIDTNNIQSPNAKRLLELFGAIQLKNSGLKLKKTLYELAQELAKDINVINDKSYDQMIEEYNKWLEDFDKITTEKLQTVEINGHKIGILEIENAAPVYSIYNNLKTHPEAPYDVIAIMIHKYYRLGRDKNNKFKSKKYTKVEFRTHTDEEIIELAKTLGGGGHKFASGTTIHDGLDKDELLRTMESFYSIPSEQPNKKE